MGKLVIRVHTGLLVDATSALKGPDIERVLRTKVARMGRFDLAACRVIVFLLL